LELQVIEGGVNTLAAESFIGNGSIEKLILKGALLEIGESAFKQCTKLKEVVIERPEGNTKRLNLCDWAFAECTSLESIDLSSVATIPYGAFENCTSLSNVTMPNETYSIGNKAFAGCKLTSIDLTNVWTLGSAAFSGCEFTSISLPSTMGVEYCALDAFSGCTVFGAESPYVDSLSGIIYTVETKNDSKVGVIRSYLYRDVPAENGMTYPEIPEQVEYIDENASEVLMCYVTEIADGAFESVQNLEGIGLQGVSALERIGARAFADCTNLTQVYGSDSVTEIGDEAFADCTNLTQVYGSYSVTEIGDEAFSGCSKLECVMMNNSYEGGECRITLPNALNSLGARVFDGCDALQGGVYFPMYPATADFFTADSFAGVSGITGIEGYCSSAGYKIPNSAFKGMTSLEYVNLRGVVSIGASAFENCTGLKKVSLFSSSVVHPEAGSESELGAKAFAGCTAITQLEVEGFTTIADDAFAGATIPGTLGYTVTVNTTNYAAEITGLSEINSAATRLVLPGNGQYLAEDGKYYGCDATSIGEGAFAGKAKITEVVFSDTITSIKKGAFRDCTALTSVVLPLNIAEIGEGAFENCTNLSTVILPSKEIQIGANAFAGCKINVVYLPETISSLGEGALPSNTKVYAVSGASLSISYEPVGERIIAVSPWASEPFSVAYDGLEKSIMVETGAINTQVSGGGCAFYIPANFEYRVLYVGETTDMRSYNLEVAASDSATEWILPDSPVVQAGTQEPGVYVVVVARKTDEATGTTVYLMTPKYKPIRQG